MSLVNLSNTLTCNSSCYKFCPRVLRCCCLQAEDSSSEEVNEVAVETLKNIPTPHKPDDRVYVPESLYDPVEEVDPTVDRVRVVKRTSSSHF